MTTDELMALADAMDHAAPRSLQDWSSARDKLRTALEAVVEDAARYRWLRDKADYLRAPEGSPQVCLTDEFGCIVSLMPSAYPRGEVLDAAVDTARRTA